MFYNSEKSHNCILLFQLQCYVHSIILIQTINVRIFNNQTLTLLITFLFFVYRYPTRSLALQSCRSDRLEATLPFRMGHRFSKPQRQQPSESHPEQNHQPTTDDCPTSVPLPPMQSDPLSSSSRHYPTANSVIIKICMLKVENHHLHHHPNSSSMVSSSATESAVGCHHQHHPTEGTTTDSSAPSLQCCQCCPTATPPIAVPIVHMSDITGEPNDDLHNANNNTNSTMTTDRIRRPPAEIIAKCSTCNHIRNNNEIPNDNQHSIDDLDHSSSSSSVKRISTQDDNNRRHHPNSITKLTATTFSPLLDGDADRSQHTTTSALNVNQRHLLSDVNSLPFSTIGISCCETMRKSTTTSASDNNGGASLTSSLDGNSGGCGSRLESIRGESESIGGGGMHQQRAVGATTAANTSISQVFGRAAGSVQAMQRLEIKQEHGKIISTMR